jgi:hypothetical protein
LQIHWRFKIHNFLSRITFRGLTYVLYANGEFFVKMIL